MGGIAREAQPARARAGRAPHGFLRAPGRDRVAVLERRRALVATGLRREGPLVLVLAMFAGLLAFRAPDELVQDGWLTLVSGRAIATNGLHAHDTLTALTHGSSWIDQQWLGQLGFYGTAALGGIKLAMIAHWLVLVSTLAMAMAIARRLGASPLAASWGAALSIPVALWGWQMRAQNLACPLFVAVLGLLLLDRRGPPRRAFLALPLLALWANLHGSVLIGVALVILFAVTAALPAFRGNPSRRLLVRCAALAAGAGAAVFASPYGLSLVHYYHSFLGNPDMKLVAEWRSGLALRGDTWPFLAVLAICCALVLRQRRRLTAFQIGVLVLTAVAGMQAIRNALWFSYALVLVLPLAIDGTRPLRRAAGRRELSRLYSLVGVPALVVALAVLVGQHESWYLKGWPAAVPARVAAAVRVDPGAGAFATERYADWILWQEPELAGRLAYDARLELLPHRTFEQVVAFANRVPGRWTELPDRYGVLVLDTKVNRPQWTALRREPGRRVLYQDRAVTVLGRVARPTRG